jgi:hypothetical protein
VVIVTIPQKAVPERPRGLFAGSIAVVVDTGNYYPARDGRIGAIDEGLTDSEWVENIRVRVVPLGSLPLRPLPTPVEPYRDPQFAELIHVIDPPRPSLVSR